MMDLRNKPSKMWAGRQILRRVLGLSESNKKLPRGPIGVRMYVVGDIHGRVDLLEELQESMNVDAGNAGRRRIIQVFLGDYIDRGPSSKEVIDWLLKGPPTDWGRICLRGNHESMILKALTNANSIKSWLQYGGSDTLQSYGIDQYDGNNLNSLQQKIRKQIPNNHVDFFSNLRLFTESQDYFFVHAGVRPGVSLKKQKEEDLLWIRDDFLFSQMDFGKVIVHGHSPVEQPDVLSNRINIDTGAYITGKLTCLVLEDEIQRFL